MQPKSTFFRTGTLCASGGSTTEGNGAVKEHVSGVPKGPATTHTPVACATYDPTRSMEVQAFIPHPNHHSALPGRITKHQAIGTVCSALRLIGAREIEIAAWRLIADVTEREAWSATDRSPVNWQRQCDLARELGIGERHFRRLEARLAGYGVLARATADNGYRGRRSGQGYGTPVTCGLSIEPAIANYRALSGIVEEAALAEETRQRRALEARTARRRIGILVASVADIETRRWAKARLDEIDASVRPACPRVASFDELTRWIAALVALEAAIREALTPLPVPPPDVEREAAATPAAPAPDAGSRAPDDSAAVEIAANQPLMSGAPDSGVRSHIQPESKKECIQDESGEEPVATAQPPRRPPPDPVAGMTLDDLRNLASDDMVLWLDALGDWQDVVPHVLRELGINVSAWHDACEAMGPHRAFLALVVIDRNQYHPQTPVQNPGGALRAFSAKARGGGLDLARSVAGIRSRTRKGLQPKGPAKPPRPS